mmetsp:Transcript_43603/g.107896  ORF Transcript_43603/g.107896 Transcript_43603/m.107896 type:complete len:315 (+) Transcript_43603:1189-2133(+)
MEYSPSATKIGSPRLVREKLPEESGVVSSSGSDEALAAILSDTSGTLKLKLKFIAPKFIEFTDEFKSESPGAEREEGTRGEERSGGEERSEGLLNSRGTAGNRSGLPGNTFTLALAPVLARMLFCRLPPSGLELRRHPTLSRTRPGIHLHALATAAVVQAPHEATGCIAISYRRTHSAILVMAAFVFSLPSSTKMRNRPRAGAECQITFIASERARQIRSNSVCGESREPPPGAHGSPANAGQAPCFHAAAALLNQAPPLLNSSSATHSCVLPSANDNPSPPPKRETTAREGERCTQGAAAAARSASTQRPLPR